MKLVIIHGPPAAGKYTVGTELAKRTGYKLFHNHVSIDCVKPVFDFGTEPFNRLVELIRMETIAEAARQNVDLIHTFVYASEIDDEHFRRIIGSAADNGGTVHIVLLTCSQDETRRRVSAEHRLHMGKVATAEMVDTVHEKYDLYFPLPGTDTLIIDNTDIEPADTVRLIIDHFGLMHL
jgi:tRNA uridine 5-carbamoylmethylation protein Kti12